MALHPIHRSSPEVQVDITQLQKIQQVLLANKSDSNTVNTINFLLTQ